MKKHQQFVVLTLLILNCTLISNAQSPNWAWVKRAGGGNDEMGNGIAMDATGNVYVTGEFHGPNVTFGAVTLNSVSISGTGDIFVVKYDPSGNVLWAKSAGGNNNDIGKDIAIDANGNVYITGFSLSTTINFGSITLNSYGNQDIVVAKYDPNGNILWAKNAGGTNDDQGASLAVGLNGDVFITGFFMSTVFIFNNDTLNYSGNADFFIAKYNTNGDPVWATKAGDVRNDYGTGIALDNNNNVYATGYFSSDSITFGNNTYYNSSHIQESDIFVVKYDSSGSNVLWAKTGGGMYDEFSYGIGSDGINVYSSFSSSSNSLLFDTTSTTLGGWISICMIKYDDNGNVLWVNNSGGHQNGMGYPCDIAVNQNGNIYLSGYFSGDSLMIGSNTLSTANSTCGVCNGLFIAGYDSNGNALWAKAAGGTVTDKALSIATNSSGSVAVSGDYSSPSLQLGTTTLANAGTGNFVDYFVAKLNPGTTEIEKINLNDKIRIFPNPANESFTLLSETDIESVEMFDATGKSIFSMNSIKQNKKIEINSSAFCQGVYFLRMVTENFSSVQKIIIE